MRRRSRVGSTRSHVVVDAKGEVTAIISHFRSAVQEVKIINPFGVLVDRDPDLERDGWNPLGDLDPNFPGFADDRVARGDALSKTKATKRRRNSPSRRRRL